jgi:hypothetical protein
LRRFIPRTGTALAEAQLAVEVELGIAEEMADRVVVEDDGVRGENSLDDEGEELEVES